MKLVKESLDKYNFERKEDKLDSLGIGQKVLIEKWLDEMEVENYVINDDLTIDAYKGVNLNDKNLVKLPEYIQFNRVTGFFINNNKLISLKGCPKIVEVDFACNNNQLESLEGCPKIVGGSFYCYKNKVKFSKEYIKNLCDVKYNIYTINYNK